jgi:hypothetical protein
MRSRNIGVGLAVLASSMLLLVGTASAHTTATTTTTPPSTCIVKSLPSFTLQGEFTTFATVADIIEVECNPYVYGTGSQVKIVAAQLYSQCGEKLTWYIPNPFVPKGVKGRGVTVTLDADGNATVAVLGGPGCSAGEGMITAHMMQEPFESFATSFLVVPPFNTTPGVFALTPMPGQKQVEDGVSSSVATIIQAEFAGGSEKPYRIASEEFYQRCRLLPGPFWILPNGTELTGPEVNKLQLDNNGNGFVIAISGESCAEGPSLFEADLESKPFTTYTTYFTIEAPRPTEY